MRMMGIPIDGTSHECDNIAVGRDSTAPKSVHELHAFGNRARCDELRGFIFVFRQTPRGTTCPFDKIILRSQVYPCVHQLVILPLSHSLLDWFRAASSQFRLRTFQPSFCSKRRLAFVEPFSTDWPLPSRTVR